MLASANLHDWLRPINLIFLIVMRSGYLLTEFFNRINVKKSLIISVFALIAIKNLYWFICHSFYQHDSRMLHSRLQKLLLNSESCLRIAEIPLIPNFIGRR